MILRRRGRWIISGGHARKEAAYFSTEQRSLVAHGAAWGNDLDGSGSGFSCALADARDGTRQRTRPDGCLLGTACDFLGCGRLLLDRSSYGASNFVHLTDGQANRLYCLDGLYSHLLNCRNLTSNLFRRFGGLCRERLHFRCNHRKPFAGVAGTGRFYRSVERKEVGLTSDGINQPYNFADFLRCFAKALNCDVGSACFFRGTAGDCRGMIDLPSDFGD